MNEIIWNYCEFKKMVEFKDEKIQKPKQDGNWVRQTISNAKKIRGSPYASAMFALKIRYIVVGAVLLYLAWFGYNQVMNYQATGLMLTIGRLFMGGIIAFIGWKVWQTIPAEKQRIEYYKKYPHLINYCPTNVKETVDDIFKKIEENKIKKESANIKKDAGLTI